MAGHQEGRRKAEGKPPDIGGGAGRQNHRDERAGGKLRQHQLDREKHRAERRVEGRGDPRARARRDHGDDLPCPKPEKLPKDRSDPRADLDDRAFAPDRGARADRQRRGERLHQDDLWADLAAAVVDRVHHLGHAVALRLGRETAHKPDHDQPADDRRKDDERAVGCGRRWQVRVVVERERAKEGEVVHDRDEIAQGDGPKAGDHADQDRDQRKPDDRQAAVVGKGVLGVVRRGFGHRPRARLWTGARMANVGPPDRLLFRLACLLLRR